MTRIRKGLSAVGSASASESGRQARRWFHLGERRGAMEPAHPGRRNQLQAGEADRQRDAEQQEPGQPRPPPRRRWVPDQGETQEPQPPGTEHERRGVTHHQPVQEAVHDHPLGRAGNECPEVGEPDGQQLPRRISEHDHDSRPDPPQRTAQPEPVLGVGEQGIFHRDLQRVPASLTVGGNRGRGRPRRSHCTRKERGQNLNPWGRGPPSNRSGSRPPGPPRGA